MRRIYPSYARAIAAQIVRGNKPIAVGVMLSDTHWRCFDHAPKVCIRTDEWALGRFEFDYLRGLNVVAIWGDALDKQFGELLRDLMMTRPRRLWACDLAGTLIWHDHESVQDLWWPATLAGVAPAEPAYALARRTFEAAQRAAHIRELEETELIEKRSGIEAAVRYSISLLQVADRVRELFRAPYRDEGVGKAA